MGARTAPSDSDHGIPASVVTWALRRFWWLIIAAGLALGLGAYTVLNTFNPGYQSQARVLVGQLAGSTDSLRASASLGQTYADALISETLLRRVFSAAGVQSPSETAILSAADVQFTVNSRILTIQMTWSDPETARKLSDLMVKEMLKMKQSGPETASVKDPTADVQSQELTRQASGALTLIQAATTPDRKIDTHRATVAMLAAMAGSVIALTLLCFSGGQQYRRRMRVRRTIAHSDYLGSAVKAPRADGRRQTAHSTLREGRRAVDYARMAARAEVRATVSPLHSLCIVGTHNGLSASEVALNLAAAFASAGREVALVDTSGRSGPLGAVHSRLVELQPKNVMEEAELIERLKGSGRGEQADLLHLVALPSLLHGVTASQWLTATDAVILVAEYDDPSVQLDLVDCMDSIVRQGAPLLGVVLLSDGRPLSRLTALPESVLER